MELGVKGNRIEVHLPVRPEWNDRKLHCASTSFLVMLLMLMPWIRRRTVSRDWNFGWVCDSMEWGLGLIGLGLIVDCDDYGMIVSIALIALIHVLSAVNPSLSKRILQ
jgi:hypothetical protein